MFTATLMRKNSKTTRYTGPFSLKTTKDFVERGKQYLLEVVFKPTMHGIVEVQLILEVEQNPYQLIITLRGFGLAPSLELRDTPVDFGTVFPYQIDCEKQFSIENTSTIPIEVYFPDFD